MATLRVAANPTSDELLGAMNQLSAEELDQFVAQVIALRARRVAPVLPEAEADLLREINRGFPEAKMARFDGLIAKREDETLAPAEHAELVALGDEVEALDARRVKALCDLARLRGVTLDQLMADLGVGASRHA